MHFFIRGRDLILRAEEFILIASWRQFFNYACNFFSNAVNFYGKIGKAKQLFHVCPCTEIHGGAIKNFLKQNSMYSGEMEKNIYPKHVNR